MSCKIEPSWLTVICPKQIEQFCSRCNIVEVLAWLWLIMNVHLVLCRRDAFPNHPPIVRTRLHIMDFSNPTGFWSQVCSPCTLLQGIVIISGHFHTWCHRYCFFDFYQNSYLLNELKERLSPPDSFHQWTHSCLPASLFLTTGIFQSKGPTLLQHRGLGTGWAFLSATDGRDTFELWTKTLVLLLYNYRGLYYTSQIYS